MITFASEQTIERPADEVWAYAADVRHHPEWMGIVDAELVSGTPTEVGALARERMKMGPGLVEFDLEVSESVAGRRVAWRFAGSTMTGEARLDLAPLGPDRTKATWSGSMALRGWRRILEPLMAAEARSGEAAELRRLKERLETAALPVPAAS
jgi:uncharacterized membrane protein